MKKVAIIGGGACGLLLANLLGNDYQVTLFEKNSKLGKKILASGNGKCNFTNVGDYQNKYNNEFAMKIVNDFDNEKTRAYLSNHGLVYRIDEENRAYPLSESSLTFLNVLKSGLKYTRILLDSKVTNVRNAPNGLEVECNGDVENFDYVVCASGSNASNLGSEYAYSYLSGLDVELTELTPSLVPIGVKQNLSIINGVRVKCLVRLFKNNAEIYREKGEVLFKDDSLSGIVIYNMSSMINRDKKAIYSISLDLLSDAENKIDTSNLNGIVHPKILEYLTMNNISDITDLKFDITSVKGKDNAQVIAGGIKISEISDDLSLKKHSNVYVGGELLDCDGMCGGYNLQFAFSCAFKINESIRKKTNQ